LFSGWFSYLGMRRRRQTLWDRRKLHHATDRDHMTRRSHRLPLLLLLLCSLTWPVAVAAQETPVERADTLYELRLQDGSTFVGRVISETADSLTFETTGGLRLAVARAQVRSLQPVQGRVVGDDYWRQDPNRTRLLLVSPTARTLPRGEGYVSAFWVVLPFVGYGITDNFTLAGGTPLIPEVIGRVLYVAPKVRVVHRPSMDLAVGAIAFFATESVDEGSLGIAYGVGTFGTSDRAVSAGAGWGWAIGGDDAWVSNDPLIMLGGEYRIARSAKLVSENFFVLGESGALVSGGVRLFGERLSVDFGLAALLDDGGGIPWLPVLNFVYNFGGNR
jgi:hypothetical protein